MTISALFLVLGLISSPGFGNAVSTATMPFSPAETVSQIQIREMEVWVTAYSSTPEETDDTPFITASGKGVADGVIATNLFDFGTKLKIPDIFGDKVFVVEDRMHRRKKDFVDIWMPTKEEAKNFGIARTKIQVLVD